MEGVAMLRQLIGQIQGLCELYGFPPPQPLLEQQDSERWYLMDWLNDKHSGDGCRFMETTEMKNATPPAKKSRKNSERPLPAAMDLSIWQDFPDDLFEPVIARLPIAAFFRLRSVCRKWNALLGSPSFSDRCSELPPPLPWLYVVTHGGGATGTAVYDPSARQWRRPPRPSPLPGEILVPVASAGGLLCLADVTHQKLFVTNPLTSSSRELPPRSAHPWSRSAVAMTSDGGNYKIVWLGCDGDHEIYDSRRGSWCGPCKISSDVSLPLQLNLRSPAAVIGQTAYFLRGEPEGIVSYDAASGTWREVGVPAPPHAGDAAIAECGGRVLLVGLLRRNAATCVCVWELQKMTLLWREVDRMPNVWCLDFYGREVKMSCLGNRRVLALSLRSRQMSRLVTYDALTREWRRVPGRKKRQWIACGASFRPSLTAAP